MKFYAVQYWTIFEKIRIEHMNIRLFAPLLCAFLGGAFVTGGICLIAHNAPGYGILFFFGGVGSLITAMLYKEKR